MDVSGATTLSNNLNLDNTSAALTLTQTGSRAIIRGTLDVSGATTLANNLTLNNTSAALNLTGTSSRAVIRGTLDVSGATTLANNLTLNNTNANLTLSGTNSLLGIRTIPTQPLDVNGNARIRSNLDVSGSVLLGNTLNVSGDTTLSNNLTLDNTSAALNLTGTSSRAVIRGTLDVSGATTLANNLTLNNTNANLTLSGTNSLLGIRTIPTQPLDVNGNARIRSNLDVSGITTLGNNLTLIGTSSLDVSGSSLFGNNLILSSVANLGIGITVPTQKLDVSGNAKIRGVLDMSLNQINNLRDPSNNQDAATKSYVDSQIVSGNYVAKTGAQTMSGPLGIGISPSVSLDVSGNARIQGQLDVSGSSLFGNFLQLPEVRLTSQTTTYNSGTIDISNRTNTYAVFEPAGTGTDSAFLRQIGGDNDIHLSLDFHDDNNDGKFSLRNIVSTVTPDTIRPFFTSTPVGTGIFNPDILTNITKHLNLETNSNGIWFNPYFAAGSYNPLVSTGDKGMIFSNGTKETGDLVIGPWSDYKKGIQINSAGNFFINKNATYNTSTTLSSSTTITIATGSTIYDFYNVNQNLSLTINFRLPPQGSTDNIMVGKTISFNLGTNLMLSSINLQNNGGTNILINGTTYTNFSTTTSFKLVGTSTIGVYTTSSYIAPPVGDSTDQLVIKSDIGNSYSEFTGIKFSNTNTDAGLIRVESDISHANSVMRIYTRSSNAVILPLEIGNTIYAYRPIIRNQWSSGELIQTKVYNQNTNGSGVFQINPGQILSWLTPPLTFTTLNNPTDSILVVEVFAPYAMTGYEAEEIFVYVDDTTGTTQSIVKTGQRWTGEPGGGTRSGAILPVMGSYTPTTTTKTRTIRIQFENSSNDILYICRIFDGNGNLSNQNNYTIKISEYKL